MRCRIKKIFYENKMFFAVSFLCLTIEQILCSLFIDSGQFTTRLSQFNSSSIRTIVQEDVTGIAQCARMCVHQVSCESAIFHKDLLTCSLMTSQYSGYLSTPLMSNENAGEQHALAIPLSLVPQIVAPSSCWYRTCPSRHRCVTLTSGKSACLISHCELRSFGVENGVVVATKGYSVGSVIHYICNEGFILNRTSNVNTTAQMTCSASGTWEGETPSCDKIIIFCGEPPSIQHGQVTPGDTREGTVRNYVCDSLYYMSGPDNITCLPTGEWTPMEGTCKVELFCGDLPSLLHGSATAGNHREDTVRMYTCDVDYYMDGEDSVTCQSNGNWSALDGTCKLELFCGDLPSLLNGFASPGNHREDTVRLYTCDVDYYMDGEDSITCQSNGNWSALEGTCKLENYCPEPSSSIPNGSITPGTRREGAERTYDCDSSYNMEGSGSITCEATGSWTSFQGECKYCLPSSDPRGLYYNGDLAETVSGVTCGHWTMVNTFSQLWSHANKCRNPDGDVRPWCPLNVVGNQIIWDYCDLHPCP